VNLKRLLLAFLVALPVLAACGGDGEGGSSPEEYFRRLETIQSEVAENFLALRSGDFPGAFVDDPEATRDAMNALVDVSRDALQEYGSLEPPPEARELHNEYVAAGREILAAFEDVARRVSGNESEGLLEEFEEDLAAPLQRGSDACSALEAFADHSGIDIEMSC